MTGKVRAVAPVLAGAEEEHLNAGFTALAEGGEDIGLGKGGRVDALMGLYLVHRADAVAQTGCALEIEFVCRLVHVGGKAGLNGAAFAAEELFGLMHQCGVAFLIDPPGAGRTATLDLEKKAGACARLKHGIRA